MKHYIFDDVTRRCVGYMEGVVDGYNGKGILINSDDLPSDLQVDDTSTLFLASDGVTVFQDRSALMDQLKAQRKARIKAEAASLIGALDWKLERAKERETAGWSNLSEVDVVLAQREAIRRSSSVAEDAVDALTDAAAVRAFTWSVDFSVVPTPRRCTHKDFAERFSEQEMLAIMDATKTSPALAAWWEKFKLAKDINLDDPMTQSGVRALEIAGLLETGRADDILGAL